MSIRVRFSRSYQAAMLVTTIYCVVALTPRPGRPLPVPTPTAVIPKVLAPSVPLGPVLAPRFERTVPRLVADSSAAVPAGGMLPGRHIPASTLVVVLAALLVVLLVT